MNIQTAEKIAFDKSSRIGIAPNRLRNAVEKSFCSESAAESLTPDFVSKAVFRKVFAPAIFAKEEQLRDYVQNGARVLQNLCRRAKASNFKKATYFFPYRKQSSGRLTFWV